MCIPNLKEHLAALKEKDEKAIRKAERIFSENTEKSQRLKFRAKAINNAMNKYAFSIADILKDYLDNTLGECIFEKTFSWTKIVKILKDDEFIVFLICSNLIKRTVYLNRSSKGEVKLRIYTAILNYDNYKKQKRCE